MKRCTEGASDGSVKRSRMLVPQSEAQQAPVAASSSPPLDVYIHGEEVVRGQFYVDRYLADLDCIFYAGQWVSRSAFEKAARSTTAKWHCSIKVGTHCVHASQPTWQSCVLCNAVVLS